MRLSLEIGCAGVKGMQTNVYLSETLDALMMDANLRDWAASPRRGSPRAKTSWRDRPAGISIINGRVRRIASDVNIQEELLAECGRISGIRLTD